MSLDHLSSFEFESFNSNLILFSLYLNKILITSMIHINFLIIRNPFDKINYCKNKEIPYVTSNFLPKL